MEQEQNRGSNGIRIVRGVYIACCLTHVPGAVFGEHCALIRDITGLLESSYGLAVQHALKDSDPHLAQYRASERPRKCYEWDRRMVEQADLVVAETSFPSTGTGIEIQIAEYNMIPVVLLYRDRGVNLAEKKTYRTSDNQQHTLQIGNRIVSIMVQGNPAVVGEIAYSDRKTAIESLRRFMGELREGGIRGVRYIF